MAKDDYGVIVYVLLEYLYGCLKKGKEVDAVIVLLEAYPIELSSEYVIYIISNMLKDGLIDGVDVIELPILGKGIERTIRCANRAQITPKGIQYLQENSMIAKARAFVKDHGGQLLNLIGL